jgi:CheY-like chemotaxis protein
MVLNEKNFKVPANWRVFVLDDTEERLRWFRDRLPGVTTATTAQAAVKLLSMMAFDLVFLDHDLSWMDAADSTRLHGNGKEVARYLARTKFSGRVVIHSKNEQGVAAMKKLLPEATVARFEEFEITVSPSPRAAAR